MISRTSAFPIWLATLLTATVVGVPRLRPQESANSTSTRTTSRPAPASQSVEVPITAGIGVERRADGHRADGASVDKRRAFFASIGIVARYDAWLNPDPSTVKVVVTAKPSQRTFSVSSRRIDAGGNPDPAPTSSATSGVTNRTPESQRSPERHAIDDSGTDLEQREQALAYLRDGFTAFQTRDYARAFEQWRQAGPLAPNNGIPRYQLAFAQFALGDYQGAASSLRRALDLLPEMADAGFDLPKLYGEAKDLEEQRRALESQLRIHPGDRESRALLVWIDFCCGDLDAAERNAVELTAGDGDDPLPAFLLEKVKAARERR